PSRSPMAHSSLSVPVVLMFKGAEKVIFPAELVFLNIEMVSEFPSGMSRSILPSPSKSPLATAKGFFPSVILFFGRNVLEVKGPMLPFKVTLNGRFYEDVRVFVVIVIG